MSLIQPLEQRIIRTLKLITYSILWIKNGQCYENKQTNKTNREYHESLRDYTTEDAIVVVKKAVRAIKLETINSTLSLADLYLEEAEDLILNFKLSPLPCL